MSDLRPHSHPLAPSVSVTCSSLYPPSFSMSGLRLLLPLAAYFVSGIGLTCFNKYLLASYNFGFPVTLILCHMLTNFMLSCMSLLSLRSTLIASAFPSLSSLSSSSSSGLSSAPLTSSSYYPSRLPFRLFLRRFVPIGVLFAIDITLTNVSFKLVPVSLTEVVKGFAPAALMLYSWRRDRLKADQDSQSGLPQLASVAGGWYGKASVIVLLSAGIALTSYGDLSFRWNGFFAALGALVAGVCKFVLLEQLLEEDDDGDEQDGSRRKVNGAGDQTSRGETSVEREVEDEEAAGEGKPVDKGGKKRGHYQQVNGVADDDEHPDTNNAESRPSVRIDTIAEAEPSDKEQQRHEQYEQSARVVVELKPIDEETKESDTDSADRVGRTLHKVIDTAAPLRRRSPLTTSARPLSVEMTTAEGGEVPTNFVLSARPASPSAALNSSIDLSSLVTPHSTIAFFASTAASSSSLLKPSHFPSSLSGRALRPLLRPAAHKRLHPLLSLFYFSPVAALVLIPTFFGLEWTALLYPTPPAISFVASPAVVYHTVGLILSSALLAFTLNLAELSLIQSTSALTLCVVATVKFLLVVVLTSVLFEHEVSVINAVGCCVSVAGVAGYNFIKYAEYEQQRVGEEVVEEVGGEQAQLMMSRR